MSEDLKSQVSAAFDSAPAPEAEVESKEVSSPDVKVEPETVKEPEVREAIAVEKVKDVDEGKLTLQIDNLNKAIAIEREEKAKLKEEIEKVKPFVEKMQHAFAPEVEVKEEVVPPKNMTIDELETWYANKEASKNQEIEQKQLQDKLNSQIKDMTDKWNGEDGKPKYDDSEVISWQRDNNKLYLMPEEAFLLMKRDDIINWETKQIIAKGKAGVEAERPSGISSEHTPSPITPKTDQELKNALYEAFSSVDEA